MDNIVRANIFDELRTISRMIDRYLGNAFALDADLLPSPLALPERFFVGDNLAVDMYEMDDAFVIEAPLPGLKPDQIEVETRSGYLTIKASQQAEQQHSGYGWRLQERRLHAWQRTLRLPEQINIDKAHADLKDGILTISLPKLKPHKKLINRIPVNLPKLKLPSKGKNGKAIKIKKS